MVSCIILTSNYCPLIILLRIAKTAFYNRTYFLHNRVSVSPAYIVALFLPFTYILGATYFGDMITQAPTIESFKRNHIWQIIPSTPDAINSYHRLNSLKFANFFTNVKFVKIRQNCLTSSRVHRVDMHHLPVGFTLISHEPVAYSFALGSSRSILGKFLQLLVMFWIHSFLPGLI